MIDRQKICDIINTKFRLPNGNLNGKFLRAAENKFFCNLIYSLTECLDDQDNITHRVVWLLTNQTTVPTCKMCSNRTRYNKQTQQFNKHCSNECRQTDPDVRSKREKTNLSKYGVKHAVQAQEIKEKFEQTNLERYGVRKPFQSKTIQQTVRNSTFEKYGVVSTATLPEVRERQEQTNLERYGVRKPFESTEIQQKVVNTALLKNDGKMTSQRHISNQSLEALHNCDFLCNEYINNKLSTTEIGKLLGVSNTTVGHYLKHYNIPIREAIYESTDQLKLVQFIRQICSCEIFTNIRTIIYPFELDIYLPELNIAIEYNGIYWHSEQQGKNSRYHLIKTKMCEDKGITLIHIFQNEYNLYKPIVESIIQAKLQKSPMRIYARTCSIREVTDVKGFLINNHIQGHIASTYNVGLYHNNELVSLMTFGKSRYDKKFEWEILRFCNKLNTNVIGGASKMFSFFIKNKHPNNIISYCDKRWGVGDVYTKMGMLHTHDSAPSYYYFHKNNSGVLFNRQSFQKHRLKDKLDYFDPLLTEYENMLNNGYDRIWDCGNKVFGWTTLF